MSDVTVTEAVGIVFGQLLRPLEFLGRAAAWSVDRFVVGGAEIIAAGTQATAASLLAASPLTKVVAVVAIPVALYLIHLYLKRANPLIPFVPFAFITVEEPDDSEDDEDTEDDADA